MQKKILFVTDSTGIGGAECALRTLISRLGQMKWIPVVLMPRKNPLWTLLDRTEAELEELAAVAWISTSVVFQNKRIRNPFAMIWDFLVLVRLAGLIGAACRKIKPDVIFTNSLPSHFAGAVAAKLAGIPCITYLQDEIKLFPPVKKVVLAFLHLFSTRIICNSSYTAAMFQGKKERMVVIYPGVEIKSPNQNRVRQINESLGRAQEEKVVSVIGRISYIKGQLDFVNAVSLIGMKMPAKYLLIGQAAAQDRLYLKEVSETIRKFKLENKVKLIAFQEDVENWIEVSDIVVVPSRDRETFGRIAVEALLQEKKVVAARLGGLPEIILDNKNGYLFEPGNVRDLSEKIMRAIQDSPLPELRSTESKQKMADTFGAEKFSIFVDEVLSEILNPDK